MHSFLVCNFCANSFSVYIFYKSFILTSLTFQNDTIERHKTFHYETNLDLQIIQVKNTFLTQRKRISI